MHFYKLVFAFTNFVFKWVNNRLYKNKTTWRRKQRTKITWYNPFKLYTRTHLLICPTYICPFTTWISNTGPKLPGKRQLLLLAEEDLNSSPTSGDVFQSTEEIPRWTFSECLVSLRVEWTGNTEDCDVIADCFNVELPLACAMGLLLETGM